MPSEDVKLTLTSEDIEKLKRAASVVQAPDMVLEKNSNGTFLNALDKKNGAANVYSTDINTDGDGKFKFYFKVDNLKLMDGDWDVEISSKNISRFVSKNIEYCIALEPESTYTV